MLKSLSNIATLNSDIYKTWHLLVDLFIHIHMFSLNAGKAKRMAGIGKIENSQKLGRDKNLDETEAKKKNNKLCFIKRKEGTKEGREGGKEGKPSS